MQKFKWLLFVWKRSYICNYIICMNVPLNFKVVIPQHNEEEAVRIVVLQNSCS